MSGKGDGFGLLTATNLIVASMVGTGVFTTSGYLVGDIQSKSAILIAWLVGGVLALCGGLAYAELGAALPGNGGEYQLLSRIYHPIVGFLAGATSLVIGFAAPIAAYGIAFAKYLAFAVPGVPEVPAAVALIVGMSAVQLLRVETSDRWQNVLTISKLALIVFFCLAGLAISTHYFDEPASRTTFDAVLSRPFADGLMWISFSYSGWNAASYIAGELRDPARTLPRAVVLGTVLVTLLYVALNWAFLDSAPAAELAGKEEVAAISARHIFGETASRVIGLVVALGLLSTTGAMIVTGPRVLEAMGVGYPRLQLFVRPADGRGPVRAIVLQAALALVFLFASTFRDLLNAISIVLAFWCMLVVIGLIVLRIREPDLPRPYKTFGYPVTPVLFILLSLWMIGNRVAMDPMLAVWALAAVVLAAPLYAWAKRGAA